MSDLSDDTVDEIIADARYFAFLDVLGYRAILFGGGAANERQRVRRLYEVWECLSVAIEGSCTLFGSSIKPVLFSDSLFLSSIDPLVVAGCVANAYANVCAYYASRADDWMPWLRGGIGFGWGVDVKDSTVKGLAKNHVETFRNPAGPGPAEAYVLAEESGLKGSRVLVPESVKDQVFGSARGVSSTGALRTTAEQLCQQPWPSAGQVDLPSGRTEVFDLPWWRTLGGGCSEALRAYGNHAWQVEGAPASAQAHLAATREVLGAPNTQRGCFGIPGFGGL